MPQRRKAATRKASPGRARRRDTAKPAQTLEAVREKLHSLANPGDASFLQGFFKTGPGQYGEGDRFLGLRAPTLHRLTREYSELDESDALEMLASSWHEERVLALLILIEKHRRADDAGRRRIHRAYLANARYVNNWDLVDCSAEHLVGPHLAVGNLEVIERLARSDDIWKRRIAIISTFGFIKGGEFRPTLRMARMLIADRHDLIHKAVGWMLREVGKRDRSVEDAFLLKHYRKMPRTMLRYAIERHPEGLRKKYLAGTA